MKSILLLLVLSVCAAPSSAGVANESIPEADRTRIAESIHLKKFVGNRLWRGWSGTPFAVLLVTEKQEFLVHHPSPSKDFSPLGNDAFLGGAVFARPRTQSVSFLATFSAIEGSGVPVIVVGQAENTSASTSTPWAVTLMHEHFHQLQYSQPDYYSGVAGLGLARGDETGMWMLNYAFPYGRPDVQAQFAELSSRLADALDAKSRAQRSTRVRAFLAARKKFQQMLSPDDFRYFAFQCWQEGISRYTELRVSEMASSGYRPTPGFAALEDVTPYRQRAGELRAGIFGQLRSQKLGESERVCFYAYGAAEGLLLDKVSPSWRNRYFSEPFDLGRYFQPPSARRR